jgi:NADPH:quinone reductase-like Zn-dependent oxidoreductase
MKAAVLKGIHEAFQLQDFDKPIIGEDEVLIALQHAALNHRDVWIQKGQYAGLVFPIICGSDGCGIVQEIGKNVSDFWLGKEVVINPSLNWGTNPKTQAKDYEILGLPHHGTFAQYVKVPARLLHVKPAHLKSEEAAAFPLAGLTAYRALMGRAKAQAGENVLITGIGGGVALMAAQFALAAGCQVYISSGSQEKLDQAIAMGAKGGAKIGRASCRERVFAIV